MISEVFGGIIGRIEGPVMLLTTSRKPVKFVLQALSLLLGSVYVQAMATIVMVTIMLLVVCRHRWLCQP